MEVVRPILWIPAMLLIMLQLSGCADSTGGDVAAPPEDSGHTAASDIISWFTADINEDAKDELLLITQGGSAAVMTLDTGEQYGTHMEIYSEYTLLNDIPVPQGEPDYQFDLAEIKPLEIQAGDINGDGIAELTVCVYKTAKFHPVPAKRPFFYDLKDGQLEPVWLGSRLARPFADYILFDVDQDEIEEIVAIEFTENGNKMLTVYDWKGFGFEVKASSDEIEGTVTFINNTNCRADAVLVEIAGESHQLYLDEGEVIKCIKDF